VTLRSAWVVVSLDSAVYSLLWSLNMSSRIRAMSASYWVVSNVAVSAAVAESVVDVLAVLLMVRVLLEGTPNLGLGVVRKRLDRDIPRGALGSFAFSFLVAAPTLLC
jgi:hypothetical protein